MLQTLELPVATEQSVNLVIYVIKKYQSLRKNFEIHLSFGLGNDKCQVKNNFYFVTKFS